MSDKTKQVPVKQREKLLFFLHCHMDGTIWGQMAKELFEAKPDCFHLAFVGNKKGNEAN